MQILTSEQYAAIHPDFRGVWSGISGMAEWIGRRTVMSGSIGLPLGFLAIEGQDFLVDDASGRRFFPTIVPDPEEGLRSSSTGDHSQDVAASD